MRERAGLPILRFPSAEAWSDWLEQNHAAARGVWIELSRKHAGEVSVDRGAAVETALRYGWIDGQAVSGDDTHWLQRFTPRGRRSRWSKINRQTAERLIARGVMHPSGLAAVESAKQDGRWDAAYDSPKTMAVPEDLQARLNENPRAQASFAGLDARNRYSILYRIHDARRPETRARRIADFIAMLEEGRTIY